LFPPSYPVNGYGDGTAHGQVIELATARYGFYHGIQFLQHAGGQAPSSAEQQTHVPGERQIGGILQVMHPRTFLAEVPTMRGEPCRLISSMSATSRTVSSALFRSGLYCPPKPVSQ
jgi:hypothetical protein